MARLLRFLFSCFAAYLLAVFMLSVLYLFIPPVSTVMLGSLFTGQGMQRQWVPLARISPNLTRAVIASEDARFCQHRGIDWEAVDKVVAQAQRTGRATRGASTITMQLAKNLFLWNGRSWLRKALEAPLALWIDLLWPKPRILEVYLNIAEWGPGMFGIEQAARHNFGTGAQALDTQQAALLAAMLPDPTGRSAARPGPATRGIAGNIARRAYRADIACIGR